MPPGRTRSTSSTGFSPRIGSTPKSWRSPGPSPTDRPRPSPSLGASCTRRPAWTASITISTASSRTSRGSPTAAISPRGSTASSRNGPLAFLEGADYERNALSDAGSHGRHDRKPSHGRAGPLGSFRRSRARPRLVRAPDGRRDARLRIRSRDGLRAVRPARSLLRATPAPVHRRADGRGRSASARRVRRPLRALGPPARRGAAAPRALSLSLRPRAQTLARGRLGPVPPLLRRAPRRGGARVLRAPWLDRFGDAAAGGLIAMVGLVVAGLGL